MAAKNKAGIVSALAELPPRELCALLDDARRKAEAEAQREAEAERRKRTSLLASKLGY